METNDINTYFVCNTITGDVFEIMKSGLYSRQYCTEKLGAHAKARGNEYEVFALFGDVTVGNVKEMAATIPAYKKMQKDLAAYAVYGTSAFINAIKPRTEESENDH